MAATVEQSAAVAHVLQVARRLTDMEAAYLAEFDAGLQVLRAVDGDTEAFRFHVGDATPLEGTFCQRVVDGRLHRVVPDAREDPMTRDLPGTTRSGIRGYVGVPVRFPDGTLYGSMCCIDREPRPGLTEQDADVLEGLGTLLGHQLASDREAVQVVRQRDELLASVTHDLRTPLMAMRFLGEDLRQGATEPAAAGAHIERESRRVLALVEDLMLVTRERAGTAFLQPAPTDLRVLVGEAAATARAAGHAGERHPLELDLPAEPLVASVDANRVLRALGNLLDNAHKHAPGGGAVRLALRREGTTALLAVSDEGMGIAPEDLPHLHERFYRSPRAVAAGLVGTGLGLSTVQAVADLHEGTLAVRSELGAGSTFELRLPLLPAAER